MPSHYIDYIISRNSNAQENKKGELLLPCPFHDDEHPSLRFHPQKGGWYCDPCKRGGGAKELAEAMGYERPERQEPQAVYNYTDEKGHLLYQVCRFPGKQFRQRRPSDLNPGEWIWDLKGVRRVPYNLPYIVQLPEEPVYVVEGEKDADNLTELGLVATTNSGGAGKWLDSYSAMLDKRACIILPDNDAAGHKDAQQKAASLRGKASSLRVLNLPVDEKGDVSDWLQAGHTAEELEALVRETPEWQPAKIEEAAPVKAIFPEESYLGWAGEFAQMYSEYNEAPKAFFYMAALTCLGALFGDKFTLRTHINPQPRLFTILVGESADDRKSTAARLTINLFRETLGDQFGLCYGVGSAEGLARRLESSRQLLLVFDEFRSFVSKSKIESSVLLPVVNTLFEHNIYHSATRKSEIKLDGAYLSLLACCTKETFQTMFGAEFQDIGFINRLFIVSAAGARRFSIPPRIPKTKRFELMEKLLALFEWGTNLEDHERLDGKFGMELDDSARALFQEWYKSLLPSIFTKRLDTYGHRLMLLLAASQQKEMIDEEVVQATTALLNYELAARILCQPVEATSKQAELEERIRRALSEGPIKEGGRGGLKQKLHYRRYGVRDWDWAVDNLKKAGEVKLDSDDCLIFVKEEF